MGKASRTKRERRDDEQVQAGGSGLPRIEPAKEKRSLPIFWIVIGLLVVAGLVAIFLTAPDDDTKKREAGVANIPTYAEVTVKGDDLPKLESNDGKDPAVGKIVPALSGTSITTGKKLTIPSGGGTARVYVVMAHWCPHCNKEVPEIVAWAKEKGVPDGVQIVGVSTSADEAQPNFPPAKWLARENWSWPALVDDEVGTGAAALGTSGFPHLVFVDKDGMVMRRFSGEMPIDDFADEVKDLASGSG